jgi:hypothetical protein
MTMTELKAIDQAHWQERLTTVAKDTSAPGAVPGKHLNWNGE